MKIAITILAAATLFLSTLSTNYADDTVNYDKTIPSITEITTALAPEIPVNGYKTRSIHQNQQAPRSISLFITFEKDSYTIDPHAIEILDILGKSLQSERLQDFNFSLEGHTDATGAAAYNQALSERRANAVRTYLTQNYGVNQDRLLAVGKGETEPLLADNPTAAANRRVKIINTGR